MGKLPKPEASVNSNAVGENNQGERIAVKFYGRIRFPAGRNGETLPPIESAVTGKGKKWRGS
jgi:hypothetical protein